MAARLKTEKIKQDTSKNTDVSPSAPRFGSENNEVKQALIERQEEVFDESNMVERRQTKTSSEYTTSGKSATSKRHLC